MTEQSQAQKPEQGKRADERSLAIEEGRLRLEERKFEADAELRNCELEIKGRESGWSSKYFTPLTTTLLAGILTLAGSVVGTIMQGQQTLELEGNKFQATRNLEKEKFEFTKEIETSKQQHELIVKMISVGDEKQARANIRFLAETGLIKDKILAKSLLAAPSVGVLPSSNAASPPEPIVPDARVFILAGSEKKSLSFNSLSTELATAKYRVVGTKMLVDPDRPDSSEIRYFNIQDQTQAEQLAEYMNFKDSKTKFPANKYQDSTAKPGYIEIWLGR